MIARVRRGEPVSVGLLGNAAEIFPELVRRGVRPDVVTDQTSAHDPVNGYFPAGWTLDNGRAGASADPTGVEQAAKRSMAVQVRAMLDFHARHPDVRLRQQHPADGARTRASRRLRLPGLRAGLHPAAVLPRHRPVPLGGAVRRSRRTSTAPTPVKELMPDDAAPAQLARHGE